MPALLDVVFSMILGLTILLIIINANVVVGEGWFAFNNDVLVQQMLISTATLLEGELRNIGYNVPKGEQLSTGVILYAGVDSLEFATDLRNDNCSQPGIDIITYFLGPAGEMNYQNEMIRVLYRKVNDCAPFGVGLVTHFELKYFNALGDTLALPLIEPGNVYMIEIEMEVQSPHGVYREPGSVQEGERDAVYATSLWRQTRLASKNLLVQTRNWNIPTE
jgi:hypothetical protein